MAEGIDMPFGVTCGDLQWLY